MCDSSESSAWEYMLLPTSGVSPVQKASAAAGGLRHGLQPALQDPGERPAHDAGWAVSTNKQKISA